MKASAESAPALARDRRRALRGYGTDCAYTVLRFWNNEIIGNIEGMLQSIFDYL
ncbi:MAG: DUF559 domain-containing protein [Candidatus Acidiferrales bacterium]